MQMLRACLADKTGATAIEYGLIAALIALAMIGGFSLVADGVGGTFETVNTAIAN
ncbi:MAG: Flp family type IVb pilin [Allorhizobium sp.]